MVTEEALAERKAALEGDPGTGGAVKISIPEDAPCTLHSAPMLISSPYRPWNLT